MKTVQEIGDHGKGAKTTVQREVLQAIERECCFQHGRHQPLQDPCACLSAKQAPCRKHPNATMKDCMEANPSGTPVTKGSLIRSAGSKEDAPDCKFQAEEVLWQAQQREEGGRTVTGAQEAQDQDHQ